MATFSAPAKPGQAARTSAASGSLAAKALKGASGVTSEQLSPDATSFPVIYEAAILYAADCCDAAHQTLIDHLKTDEGKSSARTWLMLFDLYQLTNNREEFDTLSMLFTVKFERSPPPWTAMTGSADPRRKEKREYKDLFLMSPDADGALLAEIDRFEAFARELGTCRVEFSKVKDIMAAEAELLSIVFQRLRRSKVLLWFNGLDELFAILKAGINGTAGAPVADSQGWWSLLFELTILDGRMDEYEDLGLEYAIAFEMSPPPWETVRRPGGAIGNNLKTADSDAKTAEVSFAHAGFPLNGVVGQDGKEIMQQISTFAASTQEVLIDTSGLLRIDFAVAGQFFDCIRTIQMAQKRVVLSNLNELVAALLEVFGMSKHAVLMRKKAV